MEIEMGSREKYLRQYGWGLLLEGLLFASIYPVMYTLQWGVAWHDAGGPFKPGSIDLSPYWDMIGVMYGTFGFFLIAASYDPASWKPLLSQGMWANSFAHGCVAFAHCFYDGNPNPYPPLAGKNYDKLFVAVPIWFGTAALNFYFTKKCFGNFLVPGTEACRSGNPPAKETDHPLMKCYSRFLFFQGQIFAGIAIVGYTVQWGVAWHNAGGLLFKGGGKVTLNPYWDMILMVYTIYGINLTIASKSPAHYKSLLGYGLWGLNLAHGVVAFLHCFGKIDESTAAFGAGSFGQTTSVNGTDVAIDAKPFYYNEWLALKGTNYDKLFVAVPLWFGFGFGNLYFCNKIFGSTLLPWQVRAAVNGGSGERLP